MRGMDGRDGTDASHRCQLRKRVRVKLLAKIFVLTSQIRKPKSTAKKVEKNKQKLKPQRHRLGRLRLMKSIQLALM
jgi:hypothetical protein